MTRYRLELSLALIFLASFSFLAENVVALSVGSTVKDSHIESGPGDTVVFTMLFWNSEDNPYQMVLNVVSAPKGWTVFIQPDEFTLDSETGSERILLPHTQKAVGAVPVKIIVRTDDAPSGEYPITVSARINFFEGGILSFSQEIQSTMTVSMRNPSYVHPQDEGAEAGPTEGIEVAETVDAEEVPEEEPNMLLIYLIGGIVILAVAAAIYRYA